MRTRNSKWFETKVRYMKTMEDGLQKKVTEQYVVDALSFTEAEARIIEEMKAFVDESLEVIAEKIADYKEVLFSDSQQDDKYYKVKVQYITVNEKTEKERKANVSFSPTRLRMPARALTS